jgi:hypothetical protein
MDSRRALALIAALALVAAPQLWSTETARKAKREPGVLANSYASEYEQLGTNLIRVTTRKKVQGTLDEITEPGRSTYIALQDVSNWALLRAAIEARALGFKVMHVSATQNLSRTTERRSYSSCPANICESNFNFPRGYYATDVEVAIEVTFDLYVEAPTGKDETILVDSIFRQFRVGGSVATDPAPLNPSLADPTFAAPPVESAPRSN